MCSRSYKPPKVQPVPQAPDSPEQGSLAPVINDGRAGGIPQRLMDLAAVANPMVVDFSKTGRTATGDIAPVGDSTTSRAAPASLVDLQAQLAQAQKTLSGTLARSLNGRVNPVHYQAKRDIKRLHESIAQAQKDSYAP